KKMSNNKVDISEVDNFSNDLQEASEDIRSSLDKVKEHIDSINDMDSFSGEAAKEAKGYFNELHLTILESFRGLFDDLDENLKQHLQTFESEVDSSDTAVIESDYLQDVREDINEVYEELENEDESIHETIEDVADSTSATSPDFSEVNEWKRKSVEKIKELDEDLVSFTSTDDEIDVKETMNHIETVMNNAKTSEGKARFADFKGAADNSELAKLMAYNEEKQHEEMEKAKDAKESAVKQLDETSSKDVVNKAYQEFKDGDISYEQYIAILDSVKNTSDDLDEKTIKENADEEFLTYLKDRGMLDDYLDEHNTVAEKIDDNPEDMSLSEIEKRHEREMERLDVHGEDEEELNAILQEHKNGNISRKFYLSLMEEYSRDRRFSEETYANLQALGLTILSTNNLGIAEGMNPKNGKVVVDKVARGFSGVFKGAGYGIGPAIGMYDDLVNNDKTVGEAIGHNGAAFALSVGVGLFATGVGAPVAAGLAAGAILGFGFELAYNHVEGFIKKVDKAGEAITRGISKMSTLN